MLVWILVGTSWARPQCTSDGGWGCLELADVAAQLDRDRRAERLRDKACTAMHPEACGPLWELDPEAANIAIDAAREAYTVGGASAACRRLVRLHQRGPRPLRDFAEARHLLTVACDLDDGRACDRLAVAWERIGPDDPTDHSTIPARSRMLTISIFEKHTRNWLIHTTSKPVGNTASGSSMSTS